MLSTLGLDRVREESTSKRTKGPRPRFCGIARISARPHVSYHYEYDLEEDGTYMIVPDIDVSGHVGALVLVVLTRISLMVITSILSNM